MKSWVWATAALATLAGCLEAPTSGSESLAGPGVKTVTDIRDSFRCSPSLYAQDGCVVVRLPQVASQCVGAAEAYTSCATTLSWNATVGAAPGAELVVRVTGPAGQAEHRCGADAGCRLEGNTRVTMSFSGPNEIQAEDVALAAWLEGGVPQGVDNRFGLVVRITSTT